MSKNNFEPNDIKNYLFFHYIILGGVVNRIFGFPLNKVKELSKQLEKVIANNTKLSKDFKLMLRKLNNYWNTIQFKKEFYDLEINFINIFNYLNNNNNNEINEQTKKEIKKVISIINLICLENSIRNSLAHAKKTEFDFNAIFAENNNEIEKFLNNTIKIEKTNLFQKYFYFISNFINHKIINEFVCLFNRSLCLDGKKCNSIKMKYYLFNYDVSWDETNPICLNFKKNLICKVKDFNNKFNKDNKERNKEEYKQCLRIIKNLIFKILQFHCKKYNDEENNNHYSLILKNSSKYDEPNTIDNRIDAMKLNQRRYKNLWPNTIYFVKKINNDEFNKGKRNWIVERNITIKKVLYFYKNKKYDLFNYKHFNEFIANEIKEYEKKQQKEKNITKDNNDLAIHNNEISQNNEIDSIKQNENLLKRLEGTRKKYNDDFLWFLKLSREFIQTEDRQNNFTNEKVKEIKVLKNNIQKSFESLLKEEQILKEEQSKKEEKANNFKETVKKLLNKISKKYRNLIHNIEKNLNNLKDKEDAFLPLEKMISLSNKYFGIENNNRNFFLDKKEYNILINQSLGKRTLKEKIKLFYNFKILNKKPINELIQGDIKKIICKFVKDKKMKDEELFREVYQKIYQIEKSIQENYNERYYISPFLNNNFIDINTEIPKKSTYKFLFLHPYLLEKANENNKDNPLQFIKQFINKYNEKLWESLKDEDENQTIENKEKRNKLFHFGVNKGGEKKVIDLIINEIVK